MSDDTPAAPLVESLDKLRQKHPQASVRAAELPRPLQSQCLSVDESEVRRAVLSFPAGSAGGPDGLRPQHIRDMLLCKEAGSGFLTALTAFVNMTLSGQCPSDIFWWYFWWSSLGTQQHIWWYSSNSYRLYLAASDLKVCQCLWC